MKELALVKKKTYKNPNMNQQARSAVRAAHMSVLITVQHNTHNCGTQYNTEQFR